MSRRKTWNEGILFVVSSPSGAGKTTLVREVLKRDRRLRKTVSHTTRKPRPGEKDGRDYHFVSEAAFRKMIGRDGFVEWAKVFGRYYGTSKKTIAECMEGGRDAVLVIEAKGARRIRRRYGNAVFILILPPGLRELRRRITERAGMPEREIRKRLREARRELGAMRWYPYRVVNDRLPAAIRDFRAVVAAARHARRKSRDTAAGKASA